MGLANTILGIYPTSWALCIYSVKDERVTAFCQDQIGRENLCEPPERKLYT